MQDWDISRDAPYFGFEIPGAPGKYFYVWFDAPIGYLGSFKALCDKRGLSYDEYFRADSKTELYHFIGKDISYFHNLFWPAVLHGAGCRKPTAVFVHGFLTVNGTKMSKTRGTFITARRYLERLPAEALRFYFAGKLGAGVDDIDLSLDDFVARVNSDIVGKLVNIASRCAGFVQRGGGKLAAQLPDPQLYEEFAALRGTIAELYDTRDYSAAIRGIMGLADRANQYVDTKKPWALAKDPAKAAEVLAVCTQGINLFRVLMSYLAPVLPEMAEQGRRNSCNISFAEWESVATPLLDHPIAPYEPLAARLDPKVVAQLVESPAAAAQADAKPAKKGQSRERHHRACRRHRLGHHQRLREARPARRQRAGREVRRRLGQTTAAHAGSRHREAQRVLRHPLGLRPGQAHRPPGGHDRQPRAAQDALRSLRRHGVVRQRR